MSNLFSMAQITFGVNGLLTKSNLAIQFTNQHRLKAFIHMDTGVSHSDSFQLLKRKHKVCSIIISQFSSDTNLNSNTISKSNLVCEWKRYEQLCQNRLKFKNMNDDSCPTLQLQHIFPVSLDFSHGLVTDYFNKSRYHYYPLHLTTSSINSSTFFSTLSASHN